MIDRTELHAFADDELSASRKAELATQLETETFARRELDSIYSLKRCLGSCAQNLEAPELWKDCCERLDEMDRAKRIENFVGKYAWGICGVFFVAIAMGGFFNRFTSRTVDSKQVAGYVATMSPLPTSQPKTDNEFDRMFRQVLGESFNLSGGVTVVDSRESREPGNRIRLVKLDDGYGPVAVLALLDVQHVSGLYDYEQDPSYKYGQVGSANALFWNRSDGVICMALSNRAYSEIYEMLKTLSN